MTRKPEPSEAWKIRRAAYMDAMYDADDRPIPLGYEERSARAEHYANRFADEFLTPEKASVAGSSHDGETTEE